MFNTQASRWTIEEQNQVCGGGLRPDVVNTTSYGYNVKDAGSNGNFFLLAARLAKFTGNETYAQWAEKSYKWAKNNGIVDTDPGSGSDPIVYFGTDAGHNCNKTYHRDYQYLSHLGLYTEGAAVMYNVVS